MEKVIKDQFTVQCNNQEMINYLERLSFEDGRNKELIDTVAKDTEGTFNADYYKWLHKEYMNTAYEFEQAKKEFAEKELAEHYMKEIDWNLDFKSGIVTITEYYLLGEEPKVEA